MTENLRLVGPIELTSETSQVSESGFNLLAPNQGTWCTEASASCTDQSLSYISSTEGLGTYFNYYAATASSWNYGNTAQTNEFSVCPSNWQIPTGYTNGDFDVLVGYYSAASDLFGIPVSLVPSGLYHSTEIQNRTAFEAWTRTNTGIAEINVRTFSADTSGNVQPTRAGGVYWGRPVRCIAQQFSNHFEIHRAVRPVGFTVLAI